MSDLTIPKQAVSEIVEAIGNPPALNTIAVSLLESRKRGWITNDQFDLLDHLLKEAMEHPFTQAVRDWDFTKKSFSVGYRCSLAPEESEKFYNSDGTPNGDPKSIKIDRIDSATLIMHDALLRHLPKEGTHER